MTSLGFGLIGRSEQQWNGPPPILLKIGMIVFLLGVGSFLFARHQNQVITAAAPPQLNGAHTVGARKNGWGEGTEELSATKHATHTCAALPCDPKHWSQFYTGKKPEKDGVTCQPKGGSSTSIISTTTKSAAKQAIVVMSHGSMKSTVEKVIALAKAVGENDAFQSSPIDVWASIDDTQVNPSSHHPTQVLAHARTLCAPYVGSCVSVRALCFYADVCKLLFSCWPNFTGTTTTPRTCSCRALKPTATTSTSGLDSRFGCTSTRHRPVTTPPFRFSDKLSPSASFLCQLEDTDGMY